MKVAILTESEVKAAIQAIEKQMDKTCAHIDLAIVRAALMGAERIEIYGRGDR